MAELKPDPKSKPTQDRFVSSSVEGDARPPAAKSTKTAEATVPTGGAAVAAPAQPQH
jgi:hypothetical protein